MSKRNNADADAMSSLALLSSSATGSGSGSDAAAPSKSTRSSARQAAGGPTTPTASTGASSAAGTAAAATTAPRQTTTDPTASLASLRTGGAFGVPAGSASASSSQQQQQPGTPGGSRVASGLLGSSADEHALSEDAKRRRLRKDPLVLLSSVKVRSLLADCAARMMESASSTGAGDRLPADLVSASMSAFDCSEAGLDRIRDHLLEALSDALTVVSEHSVPTVDVTASIVESFVHTLVSRYAYALPVLGAHEFLPLVYDLVLFEHAEAQGSPLTVGASTSNAVMPPEFPVVLTPNERVAIIFAAFGHLVQLYVGVTPTASDVRSAEHLRAFLNDKHPIRTPLYDLQKLVQVAHLVRFVPGVGADVGLIARRRIVAIYYNSFESGRKRNMNKDDEAHNAAAVANVVARFEPVLDTLDVDNIAAFNGEYERVINVKSRAFLALVRMVKEAQQQHGAEARNHVKEMLLRDLREWRGGAVGDSLDSDLRRFEVVHGYALLAPAFALAAVLELPRRLLESKGSASQVYFAGKEGAGTGDDEDDAGGSSTSTRTPRRKSAGAAEPTSAARKKRRGDGDADTGDFEQRTPGGTASGSQAVLSPNGGRRENIVSVQTMNDYLAALSGGKRVSREAVTAINRMVENEMMLILFGFVRARISGIATPVGKLSADDIDRCYRL